MSDACSLTENNSGGDSVTGTGANITEAASKTTLFPEEGFGQLEMAQPDTVPIQIDGTNRDPEDKENQKQQLQHEVVRSNEETDDTMPVQTLRPSSSCSASSTSSSTSSPPTTPSSVSPSSSKSLAAAIPPDHSGVVTEEAAGEEHTFAVERPNDVTTPRMASSDLLEDVEASTAQTSPSSSATSLSKATFRVSTSTSVVNIQDTGPDHEPYGLPSLLRPRTNITHNLNVRFAPLPELAPRRRKSAIPLGMAARSQLARKKRMFQGAHEDRDPYRQRLYVRADDHPEGGDYEVDSAEMRMLKKKVLDKLRKQEEEEELVEDSLVVLAKKMGSAGKHLWKRVVAQKASREDTSSANQPPAAPSGVPAENSASKTEGSVTPPTLFEEEKVDPLDEKSAIRKRNKFQFRNSQTPTLPTPS